MSGALRVLPINLGRVWFSEVIGSEPTLCHKDKWRSNIEKIGCANPLLIRTAGLRLCCAKMESMHQTEILNESLVNSELTFFEKYVNTSSS